MAWILVAAGVAAIAYPALAVASGSLRRVRLESEIRTLIGTARPHHMVWPRDSSGPPAGLPRAGEALGLLRIHSIDLETVFLEGVEDDVLQVGPGHLPWTALPGRGVSVLAAHRDMHFRDLEEVRPGDRIRVVTPAGATTYRAIGARVVDPDDRWVTEPGTKDVLRLVTCWPPTWWGPAPQRLVVTAVPVRPDRPTKAPRTPAPSALDRLAVVEASSGGLGPAALPPVGTVGAMAAGLAGFGGIRSRRRGPWWFLLWTFGVGLAGLTLLAAWAGPGIVPV